jgi:hypothetical protein
MFVEQKSIDLFSVKVLNPRNFSAEKKPEIFNSNGCVSTNIYIRRMSKYTLCIRFGIELSHISLEFIVELFAHNSIFRHVSLNLGLFRRFNRFCCGVLKCCFRTSQNKKHARDTEQQNPKQQKEVIITCQLKQEKVIIVCHCAVGSI